jgi:iron complex transport system permease protein
LCIVIAGFAIGLSAFSFQTITHNRILTPSVMGFDYMYQFTQVIIVAIFGGMSSFVTKPEWNFSVSLAVMLGFSFLLFHFYFRKGRPNLITLMLLGVVIGQVFNNLALFVVMLLDPNEFASALSNMFATFNSVKSDILPWVVPILIICCVVLFRSHRELDVMWLNSANAQSLGVDVKALNYRILFITTLLVSISTALVGPILFFGLLITNLTREWFSSFQHKTLLLGCSLLSVFVLLAGQWLVESVFHFQTTLSVVINFIGGIYFLSLLLRNKVS